MKTINYSIVRAVCALVLGVLLVAWPDAAIFYLVFVIGILFFVPGVYTVVSYFIKRGKTKISFPVAGLGSLLLGLWLIIMPAFFVGILMYVLGIVLVLAGVTQIINLSSARAWTAVPVGFFVMPVLVLVAGIVVLFNPFTVAALTFIVLGVSCIVCGASDLVHFFCFRQKRASNEPQIIDVTPVEENTDSKTGN